MSTKSATRVGRRVSSRTWLASCTASSRSCETSKVVVLRLHEHPLQLLAHEQRHLVVERRERLVEKQHLGVGHQRAQDRHRLLLAAGEHVGIAVEVDLDVEIREQLLDPLVALAPRQPHELQRIVDVVDGAQPGKQRVAVVLEHVGQPRLLDGLAVEQDLAGIERHQAGDHVDQRALAAAVRPEDRDELALRQIEVELVVDDGVVERLAQAANGDDGTPRGHGFPGGRRGREVRAADDAQLSCSSRHGTRPLRLLLRRCGPPTFTSRSRWS